MLHASLAAVPEARSTNRQSTSTASPTITLPALFSIPSRISPQPKAKGRLALRARPAAAINAKTMPQIWSADASSWEGIPSNRDM